VDTDEKRRVAAGIGEHFADLGTRRVVLKDVHRVVVVEYRDGGFSGHGLFYWRELHQ